MLRLRAKTHHCFRQSHKPAWNLTLNKTTFQEQSTPDNNSPVTVFECWSGTTFWTRHYLLPGKPRLTVDINTENPTLKMSNGRKARPGPPNDYKSSAEPGEATGTSTVLIIHHVAGLRARESKKKKERKRGICLAGQSPLLALKRLFDCMKKANLMLYGTQKARFRPQKPRLRR